MALVFEVLDVVVMVVLTPTYDGGEVEEWLWKSSRLEACFRIVFKSRKKIDHLMYVSHAIHLSTKNKGKRIAGAAEAQFKRS